MICWLGLRASALRGEPFPPNGTESDLTVIPLARVRCGTSRTPLAPHPHSNILYSARIEQVVPVSVSGRSNSIMSNL